MNIYDAVMRAADHIERNPHLFNFVRSYVPDCNTPGCLMGWVGHFMGLRTGTLAWDGVARHFGIEKETGRWHAFDDLVRRELGDEGYLGYQWDVAVAAKFLRLYAAKYLPTSDTQDQRHTTPPTATVPKYDWNGLAQRLSRERPIEQERA